MTKSSTRLTPRWQDRLPGLVVRAKPGIGAGAAACRVDQQLSFFRYTPRDRHRDVEVLETLYCADPLSTPHNGVATKHNLSFHVD